MKHRLIKLIGFAALSAVAATSAAQANSQVARMLLGFDSNGDGAITREEARNGVAQRFAAMDTNGDGTVGRDERRASRRAARFASMDTNQDGVVTLPEMEAAMSRRVAERFARFDTNGDGGVTLQEVLERSRERNRRGPMTLQDLDASTMRVFDRADRNKDGMITPDEASSMRHGQRN